MTQNTSIRREPTFPVIGGFDHATKGRVAVVQATDAASIILAHGLRVEIHFPDGKSCQCTVKEAHAFNKGRFSGSPLAVGLTFADCDGALPLGAWLCPAPCKKIAEGDCSSC
jgi:hypothetical protein